MKTKEQIFKQGSKTYYNASRFFPKETRYDIFIFYAFVRVADDYVDCIPQQKKEFLAFKKEFESCWKTNKSSNKIIVDFVSLAKRKQFDKKQIDAFFSAMSYDLKGELITTKKGSIKYMYGSAEVMGLCISRIMNFKKELYPYAQLLGRAMQYANFIRDIDEDLDLGRWYLPIDNKEIQPNKNWLVSHPKEFNTYIKKQIEQYHLWQQEAEVGIKHIPKRYRIPIAVASKMYKWTAKQIEKNPQIIFKRKVKPSKTRILLTYLQEVLR